MKQNQFPDSEQPMLFDMETAQPPVIDAAHVMPRPDQMRAHRTPTPDRVSEAYADLGGGLPHQVPELTREERLVSQSIEKYERSKAFRSLSKLSATDPEVRKVGGQKKAKALAAQYLRDSRGLYLESVGLPASAPAERTSEIEDQLSAATQAWYKFRTNILEDNEERTALARELAEHVS